MSADRLKILIEIKNEASVNQSLDSQGMDKNSYLTNRYSYKPRFGNNKNSVWVGVIALMEVTLNGEKKDENDNCCPGFDDSGG